MFKGQAFIMATMLKVTLGFFKNTMTLFFKNGALGSAAALSFNTLLAMIPMLAVNLLILSVFPSTQDLGVKIQHFIFQHLVAGDGAQIQMYIDQFSGHIQQLSWVGIVALFFTASLTMLSIEDAFNTIWELHTRPGRFALITALLRHWGLMIFLPVLLGISLVISYYFISLDFIGTLNHLAYVQQVFLSVLPEVFVFLAVLFLYKFLPAAKVKYRHAAMGALVASILFHFSKELFLTYIMLFPTYQIIFGAFAAIPIFLLWIYIVWLIVLLGAQVCYCLHPHQHYHHHKKKEADK